jgi:hypothetical protein
MSPTHLPPRTPPLWKVFVNLLVFGIYRYPRWRLEALRWRTRMAFVTMLGRGPRRPAIRKEKDS